MALKLNLVVEKPDVDDQFEYIEEEVDRNSPSNLYIKGPYMMAEGVNKNNRLYPLACHMVTELKQDGNVFYGKSKVLSTPCGQIVRSLINDGVKVGMSSRALGTLEESSDHSTVKNMKLVAIDCVADPSYPKAFVNGILESKQWVLVGDDRYTEVYENFEKSLERLPKKEIDTFLRDRILGFIKAL